MEEKLANVSELKNCCKFEIFDILRTLTQQFYLILV